LRVSPTLFAAACAGLIASQGARAQVAATDEEKPVAPQAMESIVVQGKFIDSGAKSAMKMDVPVRDTPFSVSSYSDSFMKAIETTAVCNATGLTPAPDGLLYPPGSVDDIPSLMRPRNEGGVLHHKGQVEVVSSLKADGTPIPYDIRFGVFVVFEGETEYIRRCFAEYGVKTDPGGRYACMYKRWHLIGLEVGISVASVGLRSEPTGCATGWRADAVAIAKKNLSAAEMLDGEGGYTVVGKLMPAADSLAQGCLPLGLAHGWKLLRPVAAGQPLRWSDVAFDANQPAVRVRREMEKVFGRAVSGPSHDVRNAA
jgi:predicted homoserine dehydrogenase-like protein